MNFEEILDFESGFVISPCPELLALAGISNRANKLVRFEPFSEIKFRVCLLYAVKLLIGNKTMEERVLCSGLGWDFELDFEFQLGVYAGIEYERLEPGLHVLNCLLGLYR